MTVAELLMALREMPLVAEVYYGPALKPLAQPKVEWLPVTMLELGPENRIPIVILTPVEEP